MDSGKLNDWLSLGANIGVVIGLFLLIAELNHSSQLAEVEAYQTRIKDIQELNLQLALSASLAGILVKAEAEGANALSPDEFRRAQSWYASIMRGMQGQYYQYQQGFLERESVDKTLDDIASQFYARWEEFGLLGNIEVQDWRIEIDQRMRRTNID
ncbi:MAG: hypothetical protein ABJL54_13650 [Halioglobus sp.]